MEFKLTNRRGFIAWRSSVCVTDRITQTNMWSSKVLVKYNKCVRYKLNTQGESVCVIIKDYIISKL